MLLLLLLFILYTINRRTIDIVPVAVIDRGRVYRGIMDANSTTNDGMWLRLLYFYNRDLVGKYFIHDNVRIYGLFDPNATTVGELNSFYTYPAATLGMDGDFIETTFSSPIRWHWLTLRVVLNLRVATGLEQRTIEPTILNMYNMQIFGPASYIDPPPKMW